MELTMEISDKINDLDEAFSNVESLSRVLLLYDNENNTEEGNDK